MNPVLPLYLAQAQADAGWINFVPMLLIFVIFWFVLIMPMRRRQKKLQETVSALKRGDQVITNGGIYGEVAGIDDAFILLKISDNTRIKVAKSAIAGLAGETEGGA
jgi:preprotein translocase subunit YajC